jgi:RHS repeat-associated protein
MWELTPHSGGYYHSTASYWANGALASLSGIPGYTALTYGVDGEGRVTTAQQGSTKIVCDSSCSSASTTFDPAGRPLIVKIGGTSDNDTYTYYPNTERMNTYTFTVGSTPKSVAGTLTWSANGSLRQLAITDGFNSGGTETCNFGTSTVMGYDDIGRLLSANCGSVWGQTFSYDQFGNISKTGSLTWACPPCYNGNNQYNNVLSSSISYDASGNLLNDTFHTYTWDAYARTASIDSTTCGTNGTCLIYDALGRMVEKSVNSVYTEVLYSPVGKTAIMSGQTTSSAYFPLPAGETLNEFGSTGGNLYFWHKDWLGSVRFASTLGNRASYFDRAYAPFGETYDNFGNTSGNNFAGDTQDTVSGTYDTPNRELNPNQGRWLSPDPAGLGAVDPSTPQSWNRYAYVGNNPLSFIDPLGLRRFPCSNPGGEGCGGDPEGQNTGSGFGWGNVFGLIGIPFVGPGGYFEDGGCRGCVPALFAFALWPSGPLEIGGTSGPTRPSQKLLTFLASCEGHTGDYGPYNDSRGNCTVGIGQFLHNGPCTAADIANYPNGEAAGTAMAVFGQQVNSAANDINSNVGDSLNQGEFDALVSLDFNMGLSRLQTHDVWGDVQSGNYDAVPGDITSLGAGGPGIPARRANEAQMFQSGVYNPGGCYAPVQQ